MSDKEHAQERYDLYTRMAHDFCVTSGINREHGKTPQSFHQTFNVIDEEVRELDEAVGLMELRASNQEILYNKDWRSVEPEVAEELADVVISCFSMAEAVGIDLRQAFIRKMEYNMYKASGGFEDGKLQDDAGIPKPDFGDCVLDIDEMEGSDSG